MRLLGFIAGAPATFALAASPSASADVRILNVGKAARFDNRGDPARTRAIIAVGRDRALQTLLDPTCPATSADGGGRRGVLGLSRAVTR